MLLQPRFLIRKVGRRPDSQPWRGSREKAGAKDLCKQSPTRRLLFPCNPKNQQRGIRDREFQALTEARSAEHLQGQPRPPASAGHRFTKHGVAPEFK